MQKGSTRPPSVWVEKWRKWNEAKRQVAIVAWEKEKRARDACRSSHGLVEQIPKDQTQEYNVLTAHMLEKYEDKKPPAMPCTGEDKTSRQQSETDTGEDNASRQHQERHAESGFVSEEYMPMIHTAIPDHDIKKS